MKGFRNILKVIIIIIIFNSCSFNKGKECKTIVSKENYENGRLKYIYWITDGDENEGKSYLFKKNGEKFAETDFKNGLKSGKLRTYYKDTVLSVENYDNDKLNGGAKYYNNGKLVTEGYFKDNLKIGVWNFYVNSKLVLSELYSRGKLKETIYKDLKYYDKVKNRIVGNGIE